MLITPPLLSSTSAQTDLALSTARTIVFLPFSAAARAYCYVGEIMRNRTFDCKCSGHEFRPSAARCAKGAKQSDMAELAETRILTLEQ